MIIAGAVNRIALIQSGTEAFMVPRKTSHHCDSLLLFSVAMLVGQVLVLGQYQVLAQARFKNQAPDLEVAFRRCCDDRPVLSLLGHL